MKLSLYAVWDNKADALIRFGFGNNDSSFVRDNYPNDLYNPQTRSGIPMGDLEYKKIGIIDTETLSIDSFSPILVDVEKSYKFKVENKVEKVDDSKSNS